MILGHLVHVEGKEEVEKDGEEEEEEKEEDDNNDDYNEEENKTMTISVREVPPEETHFSPRNC